MVVAPAIFFAMALAANAPAIAQSPDLLPPWVVAESPVAIGRQGVTAPPVGTSQPSPTRPGSPVAPDGGDVGRSSPNGGGGSPAMVGEVFSPISVYTGFDFMAGFEFWNGLPDFSVTYSFGIEAGITANFAQGFRFTLVPLSLDLAVSTFYYRESTTGLTNSKSAVGSRWMVGADFDFFDFSIGVRFGDRDYWENPKDSGTGESLIGNDFNREILHLLVNYDVDILRLGLTFEFPLGSKSSAFTLLFNLQLRGFFP